MKKAFSLLFIIPLLLAAQQDKSLKFYISKDSTAFLKFSGLGQVWVRYNQSNPGTTVYDVSKKNTFDIGLRRWRFTIQGNLSERLSFYTQFGQNNFNYLSEKYTGAFFHDGFLEYKIATKNKFTLGAGLSGWNGMSRYASPSIGSLLTYDAPLYQQITNGVNDQFLRKLSVHAKGIIGQFNYRIAFTTPMATQTTDGYTPTIKEDVATFSPKPANLQTQTYFMWHFKEVEDNTTPYTVGSYLGEKSVVNLGAGFIYQPETMWSLKGTDTIYHNMLGVGVDLFVDTPLDSTKALTWYTAYHYFDFGSNYIRNIGVMKVATGNNHTNAFNGAGNAFPALGTGNSLYTQVGLLFKSNGEKNAAVQPYVAYQLGLWEALEDPMNLFDLGLNYFIHGKHAAKLSLNLQNRPIYTTTSEDKHNAESRANMVVLQFQQTF